MGMSRHWSPDGEFHIGGLSFTPGSAAAAGIGLATGIPLALVKWAGWNLVKPDETTKLDVIMGYNIEKWQVLMQDLTPTEVRSPTCTVYQHMH